VNRLSIGVQSFHEDELRFLGRIHNAAQAVQCVDDARVAGFENLSMDLIFSIPGQSLSRWHSNLVQALALNPQHISAYSLIVEDHTQLARLVASKQVSPNPIDEEAEMYEFTMKFLTERGFEHYEVSNYAMTGFRSRHNCNYWNHENYLGLGPSAHSFWKSPDGIFGRRWWNIANISHYNEQLLGNKLPLVTQEFVRAKELMNERVFLSLRSDGLDLRQFQSEFGVALSHLHGPIIDQLVKDEYAALEDHRLRLTSKGYLLCDEISERLLL
jgi:oxygen-independent coproporphyrinogen-3 oxidase